MLETNSLRTYYNLKIRRLCMYSERWKNHAFYAPRGDDDSCQINSFCTRPNRNEENPILFCDIEKYNRSKERAFGQKHTCQKP